MKITKRQLLEIIKKSLLIEYSEYFGNKFIEFKNRFNKGEPAIDIARDILDEVGAGSTRIVFSFSDNPTIVIKLINTAVQSRLDWEARPGNFPVGDPLRAVPGRDFDPEEDIHGFTTKNKLQSNQWEADLTMQQLYPDIFPRTFEVADDYSWILSERVVPLKNFNELLDNINLGDETFSAGRIGNIQFQAIIEMAVDAVRPGDNAAKRMISEAMLFEMEDLDPTLKIDPERPLRGKNLFKRRIMKVLSDQHLRKMFKAMGELDIPSREFSAKNLGISTISGKLMLLDASLWKAHKKLR